MNGDPIEKLLKDIDSTVESPSLAADLADRVRRLSRYRRRRNVTGALLIVLAAGLFAVNQHHRSIEYAMQTQQLRTEIAAIRNEAQWREELVKRLTARTPVRRKPVMTFIDAADAAVDRAAFAMVYQADRMARQPRLREAAEQMYRDVNADFPRTPSAKVARDRLSNLNKRKDG